MQAKAAEGDVYDAAIIGGALSGAACAHLLLRQNPGLRILIIEKSSAFGRRVGEATVEVSTYFLSRVLGLTQHLNQSHLMKQGLRFWFANERCQNIAQCGEIGGLYTVRIPAYQVDRAVLDEEVLGRAGALGAEVIRPATVTKVDLVPGGPQNLQIRQANASRSIQARWVIDASGVAAFLARQNGWWTANTDHPTAAVWSRWRGVKDLDGLDLAQKYPAWAGSCYGLRHTATNHIMGDGWWAWLIPLKGGDVSVGVVFDQRLVDWPEQGGLGERLKEFLCRHPAGRELLHDAQWIEGDVHWRRNLPYSCTTSAGDGFVLVGDAAGFLDPFYSPGMDWISFTACSAAELILAERRGEGIAQAVERHNRAFARSYHRWFNAIYKDKYQYMADFDLMRLAFLMDLGLYYLGVASQPFKMGAKALRTPVFSNAPSVPVYHLMRTYNRRFARIAVARRARGKLGRRNHDRRFMFPGFTFSPVSVWPILKALAGWGWLELKEGWRTWLPSRPVTGVQPAIRATAPAESIS